MIAIDQSDHKNNEHIGGSIMFQRTKTIQLLTLFGLALSSNISYGALVTYEFSGTISDVVYSGEAQTIDLSPGETFHGTFVYDTAGTCLDNCDSNIGERTYGALASYEITLGSLQPYAIRADSVLVSNSNDASESDHVFVVAYDDPVYYQDDSYTWLVSNLLFAYTDQTLGSNALPETIPGPESSQEASMYLTFLRNAPNAETGEMTEVARTNVSGEIHVLTAVPLPASAWLLASSLSGLGLLRARRSRNRS